MRAIPLALIVSCVAVGVTAQVPKPFPKPTGGPPVAQPQPPPPATPQTPAPAAPLAPGEPAPESLGVTVYPGAQFITSYDAGKGQRYYLYGTTVPFADIVQYYRSILRQRGELVFEQPPVHQFDIARFREETMAFPPSVTVKDYTWGGSAGYLNPVRGAEPQRYPTIIQIVPAPAGAGR